MILSTFFLSSDELKRLEACEDLFQLSKLEAELTTAKSQKDFCICLDILIQRGICLCFVLFFMFTLCFNIVFFKHVM